MDTQAEQAAKGRRAFQHLPEVEKQRLRCEQRMWYPHIMQRAEEIILALAGANFDSEELQEIHQIYLGYFHVVATRAGYEQVKNGGRRTTVYKIKTASGKDNPELRAAIEKLSRANAKLRGAQKDVEEIDKNYKETIESLAGDNAALNEQVEALEAELKGAADRNEKLMLANVEYGENFSVQELRSAAKRRGIKGAMTKPKAELIELLNT